MAAPRPIPPMGPYREGHPGPRGGQTEREGTRQIYASFAYFLEIFQISDFLSHGKNGGSGGQYSENVPDLFAHYGCPISISRLLWSATFARKNGLERPRIQNVDKR